MSAWLETPRLKLRRWIDADRPVMAAMNADPENNKFFTRLLDASQTASFIEEQNQLFNEKKIGLMAVERKDDQEFIGYCGLSIPKFETHFTPCVEIAWKLGKEFWGKGYATEAAKAVLHFGFSELNLPEIVALTASINTASRGVMTKIGMQHNPADDYKHPKLAPSDPLSDLVLYRLNRSHF